MILNKNIFLFFCLLMLSVHCLAQKTVVALGDLEGNYPKLISFLKNSDAFMQNSDGSWSVKSDYHFVFLGDAVDKEAGNVRVIETLLNIKKSDPNSVTLIIGNRDISKLTMYNYMQMNFDEVFDTLKKSYRSVLVSENLVSLDELDSLDKLKHHARVLDNDVLRLKTLFHIMNTNGGFEHIKNELTFLNPNSKITDQDVVKYFYKNVRPGGAHFEYLQNSQIIKKIGNTIYTHGATKSEAIGYIPGRAKNTKDLNRWMLELNEWTQKEISDWGRDHRAAQDLIKYSTPTKGDTKNINSLMYNRFSDAQGNVKAPEISVRKKLKSIGVNRIVVGHTPVGSFPVVAKFGDFEVVLTDVSSTSGDKSSVVSIKKNEIKISSFVGEEKKIVTSIDRVKQILPDGYVTKTGYRVVGKDTIRNKWLLLKVTGSGRDFKNQYIHLSLDEIFKIGLKVKHTAKFCREVFSY